MSNTVSIILVGVDFSDVPNSKFLIVQERSRRWNFPSGRVNKNEQLLEAAKREFYEETGLNLDNLNVFRKFVTKLSFRNSNHFFYVYAFKYKRGFKLFEHTTGFRSKHNETIKRCWASPEDILRGNYKLRKCAYDTFVLIDFARLFNVCRAKLN